jgi:hypothetical protein
MSATKNSAEAAVTAWRTRIKDWHEQTRDPGLTALLIIEAALIFLIIPLSGMGVLPSLVVPVMFVALC